MYVPHYQLTVLVKLRCSLQDRTLVVLQGACTINVVSIARHYTGCSVFTYGIQP